MFQSPTRKFDDARTLADLCTEAEKLARGQGCEKPVSEHFVLAALALVDGTAQATFDRLSLTQAGYSAALAKQRDDALASVDVAAAASTPSAELLPPKDTPYEAAPSGQDVVSRLADLRHTRKDRGLVSADVLLAVAQEKNSSAARAFHALGVNNVRLVEAALGVIKTRPPAGSG